MAMNILVERKASRITSVDTDQFTGT